MYFPQHTTIPPDEPVPAVFAATPHHRRAIPLLRTAPSTTLARMAMRNGI